MFQKHKHHFQLLKTVLSDAQNEQASNPYVIQWLNETQDAVGGAEKLIEEVNSEALRLRVEGRHQNFAKTISNQQGHIGSKITVTTRKESVALMMGSGTINMGTLSCEVSWALFKRHSLENSDPEEHPELEEVGKQIAHKCKGLPLALKELASILSSKSEVDEWRDILRSEIWELPRHSNGMLPGLMLRYNDLRPHLKRCFAYCVIYPKDYLYKEQVIHL